MKLYVVLVSIGCVFTWMSSFSTALNIKDQHGLSETSYQQEGVHLYVQQGINVGYSAAICS